METAIQKIPRPAATVILVRPHKAQFQVYLLKRNEKSGFMGGYYVFPGGTVDAEDRSAGIWQQHVDMASEEIAHRLGGGISVDEILAYAVAALRETFEEAGVLLVHQARQCQDILKGICSRRLAESLPEGWFKEWIVSEDLKLALRRLTRWSHWITPEQMKRRYNTRFFMAVLSADQDCLPDGHETTHGLWTTPQQGLKRNLDGRIPLSPPTLVTLHELSGYRLLADLESAFETRPWGKAIFPRMIPLKNGAVILEPWDPLYRQDGSTFDPQMLAKAVRPVGAPFSRLWLDRGIWRPVACA